MEWSAWGTPGYVARCPQASALERTDSEVISVEFDVEQGKAREMIDDGVVDASTIVAVLPRPIPYLASRILKLP